MATAIPAANLKVFPSANDINSGTVGSGNIVTEVNIEALLASLPPNNFVISGFEISFVDVDTVNIAAGSAYIAGRFVEMDATLAYTLDPVPAGGGNSDDVYFFLELLENVSGNATGAEITNDNRRSTTAPTGSATSVILGMSQTNTSGELMGASTTFESKRYTGGGVFTGSYVGVSTGSIIDDGNKLQITLPFAPSFVYVAGDVRGTNSKVVSASPLLPAGERTVDGDGTTTEPVIGGTYNYSPGWAMCSASSAQKPNFLFGSATWDPDSDWKKPANTTTATALRSIDVTVAGAEIGMLAMCTHSGITAAVSEDEFAPFAATSSGPYMGGGGGSYTGTPWTAQARGFAWVSESGNVRCQFERNSAVAADPASGTIYVLVIDPTPVVETSANVTVTTTVPSVTTISQPVLTNTGFIVNDGNINETGMSLNANGQTYYYWAFSA